MENISWRMQCLKWKIWKNYSVVIYKDKLASKIGGKKKKKKIIGRETVKKYRVHDIDR